LRRTQGASSAIKRNSRSTPGTVVLRVVSRVDIILASWLIACAQ